MTAALYLPLVSLFSTFSPQVHAPRPSVAVVNVCDAVTRRAVEDAVASYTMRARWDLLSRERCEYLADEGRVTIRYGHSHQALDVKSELAALKKAFPDSKARMVSTVAAPAILLDIRDSGAQVFAVAGDHDYVMVSILGFGESAHISETAQRLARSAMNGVAR
jgi:hypothetical protein